MGAQPVLYDASTMVLNTTGQKVDNNGSVEHQSVS